MLWLEFLVTLLLCLAMLYAPGMLLLRVARFNWAYSVSFAPAISCCFVSITCLVLPILGITCSWATVLLALACSLALACAAVCFRNSKKQVPASTCFAGYSVFGLSSNASHVLTWLVALVVSVFFGVIFFLANLESPDSFYQAFDNAHHINGIAAFVETGNWSSFDGGFYPSCWQDYAAFASSCLGVPVPLSINALNFSFAFVVYPLSMALLLFELFYERPLAVFAGGVLSTAFVAFPWQLLVFGPIYPNLSALSVLPSVMALFISAVRLFERKITEKAEEPLFIKVVFFALGCVGLFFLQPNVIFSAVVFLALFCAVRFGSITAAFRVFEERPRIGFAVGFSAGLLLIVAIWSLLFMTPFIQELLGEPGYVLFNAGEALFHAASLSFTGYSPQVALAALCALGVGYSLINREYLWISGAAVISMALFVIAATDCNGFIRNFTTGCWYHDAFRLAGNAVMACVPLAGIGFFAISEAVGKRLTMENCRKGFDLAVVSLLILLTAVVHLPAYYGNGDKTAFKSIEETIGSFYSERPETCILTEEERVFSEQVKEIVGDSVVVNVPDDGSVFLYGTEGINVYYRLTRIWDPESESFESRVMRTELDGLSSSDDAAEAVRRADARYVLLLDKGATKDDGSQAWLYTWRWYADWWDGIMGVDDGTPGFELVLSEGDMRLYRIAA